MTSIAIAGGAVAALVLFYLGRGFWAWLVFAASPLLAWALAGIESWTAFTVTVAVLATSALIFGIPMLRRLLVSWLLMRIVGGALPTMGDTERIALEAGTVWWDGDLFSGNPHWKKLIDFEVRKLTAKERDFIDGPVDELCAMLDDWQIAQDRALPKEVWEFLKQHRFFGMIIPERYGGLGFSAIAHSTIVAKISSRSAPAAVTVMVPNSLGPGELLLHYGTQQQKEHYLPRLARGEEIPCFALTEPTAGSDAAATKSTGIVCRGIFEGKEVVGVRLNWEKRYITLAPVATLIGLAFRLFDPEKLLGGEEDRGITCALLPSGLPGIQIGQHHDPMGVPFPNGPIFGKDVFVPISYLIGGAQGIGQGWRMLMESLAAGRSISLPALSVGAAKLSTCVVGAYGTVREQFNMPIGRFEGVEEAIARIAGYTYLMDATRRLTCGAVDAGERPAVLSGIAKAYLTDGMRTVLNDALDIRAGSEICRGPRNILGRIYTAVPVAITVEGANILTRSLIVFGQGVIRSHPFVREEIDAANTKDKARFDRAFFGHINFMFRNLVRTLFLGLGAKMFVRPPVEGPSAPYYRSLTRLTSSFALLADVALLVFGGDLKRREKISGRLADALAWSYLASATLKRFHDEGHDPRDVAVMRWSVTHALHKIEEALAGVLDNLPNRFLGGFLRAIVLPLGRTHKPPRDSLGAEVATAILHGGELRRHLASDIYVPAEQEDGLGALEAALAKVVLAQPVQVKLKRAQRKLGTNGKRGADLAAAVTAGVISPEERTRFEHAEAARDAAIQVDIFPPDAYRTLRG
jgi:acyl-CoA dehydrogenase